jgi:hypothetical protein
MKLATMQKFRNQMLVLDGLISDLDFNRLWTEDEGGDPKAKIDVPGGYLEISYIGNECCDSAYSPNGDFMLSEMTQNLHRVAFNFGQAVAFLGDRAQAQLDSAAL